MVMRVCWIFSFTNYRISIVHGQMKADKDYEMQRFVGENPNHGSNNGH